eukprot:2388444-Rhodomonas_salina.1
MPEPTAGRCQQRGDESSQLRARGAKNRERVCACAADAGFRKERVSTPDARLSREGTRYLTLFHVWCDESGLAMSSVVCETVCELCKEASGGGRSKPTDCGSTRSDSRAELRLDCKLRVPGSVRDARSVPGTRAR